jgi:4-diphosphocytidyl-2C-methyl-D-erythritol kinase
LGITGDRQGIDLVKAWTYAVTNNVVASSDFINEFERAVFVQHPILATLKDALYENGAMYASMSGSGSTMFGLFTDVEKAVEAQQAFAGLSTYICSPVNEPFRTA